MSNSITTIWCNRISSFDTIWIMYTFEFFFNKQGKGKKVGGVILRLCLPNNLPEICFPVLESPTDNKTFVLDYLSLIETYKIFLL